MTSIIKLTVLSGAYDEGPLCYLLQVDEFRFLLDCGWNESFSAEIMEPIKKSVAFYETYEAYLSLGAFKLDFKA